MKKGRHRRFEEARALKRSHEVDLADLFEDISDAPEGEHKPEHDAWADMAEEWDNKQTAVDSASDAEDDAETTASGDTDDGSDASDGNALDNAVDDTVEDAAS